MTVDSMIDKLTSFAESDNSRGNWPLTSNILDPICSDVVVNGPAKIAEAVGCLMAASHEPGRHMVVCRLVNHFDPHKQTDNKFAYRNVQLSVIYRSETMSRSNLRIIGGINIHDGELYRLQLKMQSLHMLLDAASSGSVNQIALRSL